MNSFKTSILNGIQLFSNLHRLEVDKIARFRHIDLIKLIVCTEFDISPDVVFLKTRKREIVQARQFIQHFTKKYTNYSLSQIGSITGGKDHATVLHSYNTVENLRMYQEFDEIYNKIDRRLQ